MEKLRGLSHISGSQGILPLKIVLLFKDHVSFDDSPDPAKDSLLLGFDTHAIFITAEIHLIIAKGHLIVENPFSYFIDRITDPL
jgi:hypothetical protein